LQPADLPHPGASQPIPSANPSNSGRQSILAQTSPPGVERISLADAKAAFDAESAVFLDVRDAQSYAEAHIPGALNIPVNDLPQRLDELDPSDWIITYCT
jgi:3-mercaptopyruvate sulfurtransferase SseA